MRRALAAMLTMALLSAAILSGCVVEGEPTATPRPGTTPVLRGEEVPTMDQRVTPTKPSQQGLQGVVSVWHSFEGVDAEALEQIINAFTEEYPKVGFRVTYVAQDEIKGRLAEEITPSGGGPDLIIGPGEWASLWYEQKLIQDVEPLPTESSFWDEIDPLALSFVQQDNLILGIPLTMHGTVLIRNTSIVPEAPATWDELVAAAQAATEGDMAGAGLDRGFRVSGAHLMGLGGTLMDDEGLPAFADERGVAWIELLQAYEAADPNATLNDQAAAIEAFAEGKVGLFIGSSELVPQLEDAIGAENLAIDAWPAYGDGSLEGFAQTNVVYMNKFSTYFRRTISWEFMSYLIGETAQSLFSSNRHIPTRVGVATDNALLQDAEEIIRQGTQFPVSQFAEDYIRELDAALVSIFEAGEDPQAALDAAAAAIRTTITGLP